MKKYTLSHLKLLNSPNCREICMITKSGPCILDSPVDPHFIIKNFLNLYFPMENAVLINYIKKFKFGTLTIS